MELIELVKEIVKETVECPDTKLKSFCSTNTLITWVRPKDLEKKS